MNLPIFQTSIKEFSLMQTKWASILNAILNNQTLQTSLLQNISLSSGTNVVNHLLGKKLTGWKIVGINALATIYDGQDTNQTPERTLILISSAPCWVNLEVF